ncbi:MAG: RNA polymerase factor sigma-54 [Thiofilum sp.]|uniref:RNA polymerase factor sigma-54 n=2 Tax=Thiofilum sp. TaxID=2212733 RepID=UPI0025D2E4DB|nr:RNA polymerase factor sigma-54 [Thiofilum sp.]MBK8455208.1 RNA polymerase factor sigma-54 [Thiofilum sp.]
MLKQGLDIRLGQSLSMTPQLQQAIRLLQLSSIELEAEIQQALEENPLLQVEDEDYAPSPEATEPFERVSSEQTETYEASEEEFAPVELGEDTSLNQDIPDDIEALDTNWNEVYDSPSHADDGDINAFIENQADSSDDLQSHLLWQINMSNLSTIDKYIAEILISCLDGAGYLTESLEDIHLRLNDEIPIDLEDIQCVLTYIQQLDPLGVGARHLGECLLIQLKQLPSNELQQITITLVEKHLDLLEQRHYKEIMKRLKISQTQLEDAVKLLRTLQPRPGSMFSNTKPDYIVPDAYVRKVQGKWVVSLNPNLTPHLNINQQYADLIGQSKDAQTNSYLKGHLQQARWLIRSLDNRNSTVLSVAQAIVERQHGFMQYGEQAMKPLVLRDVAEELQMHESTISRVTTNKYLHTPRGIYEFKYFFSSQLDTNTGASCSSTAIRAMIKQLIEQESPQAPLSDSYLTQVLQEQGINVARRTVAKYREAMLIPSSHERKTLLAT